MIFTIYYTSTLYNHQRSSTVKGEGNVVVAGVVGGAAAGVVGGVVAGVVGAVVLAVVVTGNIPRSYI